MVFIVVSGEVQTGKTTFVKNLAFDLWTRQISAGGVVSLKYWVSPTDTGYKAYDLMTFDTAVIVTRNSELGERIGENHFMVTKGFDFGKQAVNRSLQNCTVTFIDEVGQLELRKQAGLYSTVRSATQSTKHVVVVVRRKLLPLLETVFPSLTPVVVFVDHGQDERMQEWLKVRDLLLQSTPTC